MPNEANVRIWDHTKAKHAILQSYLGAWYTIIGGAAARKGFSSPAMWYVDWFAGLGLKGDYEGSPLRALEVILSVLNAPSRDVSIERCPVVLLDADAKCVENLLSAIEEKMQRTSSITLLHPSGLDEAAAILRQVARGKDRLPVVCLTAPFQDAVAALLPCIPEGDPQVHFIDPHGYSQIPFSAVRSVLSRRWAECLINFMADYIYRFQRDPGKRGQIDEVFGDSAWSGGNPDELGELYRTRLQAIADDLRVCWYPVKHEQTGHRDYYHLVHASHHQTAFTAMKEAMWKQSPSGDIGFAGAQHRMFAETPSLFSAPSYFLSNDLIVAFAKRRTTFGEIRTFVESSTRYTKKHASVAIRELEEQESVRVTRPPSVRGKRCSDDCVIQFS